MANEEDRQRLSVFFYYCTEAGHEPVREWLKELDPDGRRAIGADLLRVHSSRGIDAEPAVRCVSDLPAPRQKDILVLW